MRVYFIELPKKIKGGINSNNNNNNGITAFIIKAGERK
jgi:hypothetical protein